ncbi:hypothetical protein TNCV_1479171 [Trichonephila clavipes]|nr:hypothetical protein TNCV_1479171 [Trichonephila clavipes]
MEKKEKGNLDSSHLKQNTKSIIRFRFYVIKSDEENAFKDHEVGHPFKGRTPATLPFPLKALRKAICTPSHGKNGHSFSVDSSKSSVHVSSLSPAKVVVKVLMREVEELSCQVIYSQFGLAIDQNDHQARRRFVEWAQNEIAVVPDFHKRILFSDEAHFWLNGYVNKQNCHIWREANPQVYDETPLHREKLTVWCALWAGGILLQKR